MALGPLTMKAGLGTVTTGKFSFSGCTAEGGNSLSTRSALTECELWDHLY